MNTMISNPNILRQSSHNHLSFLLCIFALGIVGFLFLLGQARFTNLSRLVVWIGNLALCTAALFLITLMHPIIGIIFSWLPNRSHSDREFEGADDLSHHHHDQDTLPQAPAQDIATLFHMVLMEVLDRVWEDLVMEEGPEQMPQALQVQALEALPPPLRYCTGSRDITSSCCSDRCTICLEDYMDGESCRVFACKHMFHSNCIDHWLKNHLTCPVCRNSVVDI
ncbi:hypothetical protein FF1_030812 [Malus domestica]